MRRQFPIVLIVIGIAVTLFALLGITNSEHTAAKIVYGILIPAGIVTAIYGIHKQRQRSNNPPG